MWACFVVYEEGRERMQEQKYLLMGLLEDILLVGEVRRFEVPVVDVATLRAVRETFSDSSVPPPSEPHPASLSHTTPPQIHPPNTKETQGPPSQPSQSLHETQELAEQPRWIAISISSALELPLMVASRWATACRVLRVEEHSIELQGLSRVRLAKAHGKQPPYRVTLQEAAPDDEMAQTQQRLLAQKLAQLFGCFAQGGYPESDEPTRWETSPTWLPALMRQWMGSAALRTSLSLPPLEMLESLAHDVAQHKAPKDAAVQFEEIIQRWLTQPSLTDAMRRQLWSQLVAIQRRIDLYDPEVDQQEAGDELTLLEKSLSMAGLPTQARQMARRQLRLLRGMSRSHHDYSSFLQQIQLMAQLPWNPPPTLPIRLHEVRAALDQEHTGLEKPKKRILEYLAVRALGGQNQHTVLCLVGPPGTGKTSIARSIARALGRPFVRVALGGVHDEAEIRGHRLSYTAASPGRILEAVARAGSANAVMLLDEIDKVSDDRRRSPEAALLEVLDPEQHHAFRDNFLSVPFDLSHLFFLCTANDLRSISEPLRDRLEVIELDGYLLSEKRQIVRSHILPKLQKQCGLSSPLHFDDALLSLLIEGYTREAGVRQIQRCLEAVFRHRALEQALSLQLHQPPPPPPSDAALPPLPSLPNPPTSSEPSQQPSLSQEEIIQILGKPRYRTYQRRDALPIGTAQGLSVLASSGMVMNLEVGLLSGDGTIHATGRLGEVMRESAQTVWNHLKLYAERYGLERSALCSLDLHLHLPEAAQPKDGPSAGLALVAALLSALKQCPLSADLALSGECSLSGDVLSVGGIRAKVLAAERSGLKRLCLPLDNQIDVPQDTQIQIFFVQHTHDILPHLFSSVSPPLSALASSPQGL